MNKLIVLTNILAIFMIASVSAATLSVDASGVADYTSIQAAINAASSGDVITIADGTYSEALTVNKALSLEGETTSGVIIDTSATGGYSISVSSSDVSLSGFTLIGNGGSASYGIKVSPLGSATEINTITIEDVVVQDTYRSGIDFNGVDQITLSNVEVYNTVRGVGIAFTDSTQITVDGATTLNNAWGGIALFSAGRFYPPASTDDVIITNTNVGEVVQLYSQETEGTVTDVSAVEFLCMVTTQLAPEYTWYFYNSNDVDTFLSLNDNSEAFDVICDVEEEVPEMGILAAGLVLALAGLFIYKKRSN